MAESKSWFNIHTRTNVLSDLMPKERLFAFQDIFAKATGVASSIVYPWRNGHFGLTRRIVPESNCTTFCGYWVRKSHGGVGKRHCAVCDSCPQLWQAGRMRTPGQCLRNGTVFTNEEGI